ncbi:hypothetical protein Q9K02_04830 [Qipengyuania sp. G39]|uniref:Tryptophan-rich sensory protein n=1 Tax=Qipengyuania profundimaris TaxID=3067652 RepID=A0ABT9HN86_9SPHN|nr:hypothetical protein [Qipengyuania sp. G39]MDP4574460.1 hypothetical protein [Qipengyuania sp. G39]
MMQHSTKHRSLAQRVALVLAVVIQVGSTFLPQLGFGEPIGKQSDSVRTLVTPIGWAFGIWGPLFLLSTGFVLWQLLPAQRDNALIDRIGWYAVVALASQGVWALYTQFADLTWISVVIIATSLVSLLAILRVLTHLDRPMTGWERFLIGVTFSALAAWLTAANIVNTTAALRFHGVGAGDTYPLLAAAIVAVGGVIAALAVLRSAGNPWYALVFLWALWGIYNRGGQESGAVAVACGVSALLVVIAAIVGLRHPANRKRWLG